MMTPTPTPVTAPVTSPAASPDKYAHLIDAERVRAQYNNLPVVLLGTVVASSLCAAVFIGSLPLARIGVWLALWWAVALGRWGGVLRPWRRAGDVTVDDSGAIQRIYWGALAGGCAWGAAGVLLFVPDSAALQAWLAIWLAGMGVSSIPAYSAHLPVHRAYFLPSLAPFVVALLLGHSPLSVSMGLGVTLYAAAMLRFAKNFNQILLESLRLRFESLDLVAELRVQKSAAETANLAKSRFLAAASHDLRQPMHAMSFYLAALGRKPLPPDELSLTQNLQRCADAMDGMFGALLDISRLDASIVTPEVSAFALNDLLERVRAEFEPRAQQKQLDLRVRPTTLIARTDPRLLERVLTNLVSNAVHYTDHGRVLIACRARGATVQIGVYDTGRGIPEDKQHLVFEEFFQLHNPERDRAKGLGLGLAVVDRLVKLLGLQLTLKSAAGKGTAFTLAVPRADKAEQAGGTARSHAHTLTGEVAGALVLVVDDEADVRDATRVLLQSWDIEVVTAASGAEALTHLAALTRRPDVLICDYRLRDTENALGVIEAIRGEFNHDIPALLITGDTAPDRLQDAQASGLTLLHKPVDSKRLHQALALALLKVR